MRLVPMYLLLLLSIFFLSSCQEKSAEDILRRSLAKIDKIKTVEQVIVTELYDSANFFFKTDTSAYFFDFTNSIKISGSRYHCPGAYLSPERNARDYNYDVAKLMEGPYGRKSYKGPAEFYVPILGSVDAVKRFLPNLLSDSSIQISRRDDSTFSDNVKHHHIQVLLRNRNIEPGGELREVSYAEDHLSFSYDLFFNSKSGLPAEISYCYRYLDEIKKGWTSSTLQYTFNPQKPDSIWNLTTNPLDYISYSRDDERQDSKARLLVQIINNKAPGWELPDLSGNMHSLDDFSDKLLLMEFWYVGCGGCRRSIPFLNQMKNSYDPQSFDVVGINFVYNTNKEQLKEYVRDKGMKFLVLDGGAQTAIEYKVIGAPLILLIKNGIIIHAVEGYNEEKSAELNQMIEKHI